jgi:hypothetical protein
MKKTKLHSFKFYYLVGAITLIVSILVAVIGLSLTLVFPGNQMWGWISFAILLISLPFVFFGIYLLKKGNFVRLNNALEKTKNKNLKK